MVGAADRTPRLSRALAHPNLRCRFLFSGMDRFHSSPPTSPSPRFSPPSANSEIPFTFDYPQIRRIRHSFLVKFLYHYLNAQNVLRVPLYVLPWGDTKKYLPRVAFGLASKTTRCITLWDFYVFAETLFIGHFVRSPIQKTSPFLLLIFGLDITVIYALQSLIPMR